MAKAISKMSLEELEELEALLEEEEKLKAQTKQKTSKDEAVVLGAAGAAAAGGAAFALKPKAEEISAKLKLGRMGRELGIKGRVDPSFIPQEIQNQIKLAGQEAEFSTAQLRSQLSTVESKQIPGSVDRLASTIKKEFPGVMKEASNEYMRLLTQADALAQEQGFTLTNKQFIDDVVDPSIKAIEKQGGSDASLRQLKKVKSFLRGKKGASLKKTLPISQARAMVAQTTGKDPFGATSAVIRGKFHDFLEVNSPDNLKSHFAKMNSQYKEFAQIRRTIIGTSDYTGEFNTQKVRSMLHKYAKSPSNDVAKTMSKLGQGGGIVKRVEGVAQEFNKLKDLSNQQHSIKEQLGNIKVSKSGKVLGLTKKGIQAQRLAHQAARGRATFQARNPATLPGRVAAGALGLRGMVGRGLRSAVPVLGVGSEVLRMIEGSQTPEVEARQQFQRFLQDPVGAQFGTDRRRGAI